MLQTANALEVSSLTKTKGLSQPALGGGGGGEAQSERDPRKDVSNLGSKHEQLEEPMTVSQG